MFKDFFANLIVVLIAAVILVTLTLLFEYILLNYGMWAIIAATVLILAAFLTWMERL